MRKKQAPEDQGLASQIGMQIRSPDLLIRFSWHIIAGLHDESTGLG